MPDYRQWMAEVTSSGGRPRSPVPIFKSMARAARRSANNTAPVSIKSLAPAIGTCHRRQHLPSAAPAVGATHPAAESVLPRSAECLTLAAMIRTFHRIGLSADWKKIGVVGLALMIGFVATPAFGASLETKEKAARAACLTGDYAKGVTLLSELFIATKNPTWIFNLARCAEQNSKYQEAISNFKEYLRVAKRLTGEEKADVEKHIADCQESLAVQTPLQPTSPVVVQPATLQPAPSPDAQPPAIAHSIQEPPSTITTPPAAVESGATLRRTGIVVGSVGLATVAAAVILNLKANQLADSGDGSGQKSYKDGALTCYGVGGAATAAGIVMYLLGHKAAGGQSTGVALLPFWTPGGATLAIRGDF
jgi:hypothetical protein